MWPWERIHLSKFGEFFLYPLMILDNILDQLPCWLKLVLILPLDKDISHMMETPMLLIEFLRQLCWNFSLCHLNLAAGPHLQMSYGLSSLSNNESNTLIRY